MGNLVCPKCKEPHAVSQQIAERGRDPDHWKCEKCSTPFFLKIKEKKDEQQTS